MFVDLSNDKLVLTTESLSEKDKKIKNETFKKNNKKREFVYLKRRGLNMVCLVY